MFRLIFPLIYAVCGALATYQTQFPLSPSLYSSEFVTPTPPTINAEFRAQYMQVSRVCAVIYALKSDLFPSAQIRREHQHAHRSRIREWNHASANLPNTAPLAAIHQPK